MTNEIEYAGVLKSWLELRGYKTIDAFQNKLIYYSNSSIYPSNTNLATIVIIENIHALASIEEITLHCQSLYNLVETFFKKHRREFKHGVSFIALFVFSSNRFKEETWNYFIHNKPASKSYSGTYIPILVDLEVNKLGYFSIGINPIYQPAIFNPLSDQLELLFQIPLNENIENVKRLEQIINSIRQPEGWEKIDWVGTIGTMTLGELKTLSNQLLFQGLMKTSDDYHLHLLYYSYLAEFFITLESKKDVKLSSNLSLASLLSLENFIMNITEDLESAFMKGFNETFNFGIRMDEINTIRKNLVLQGHSIVLANCVVCGRIVKLTDKMHCPNGHFHILKKKLYFDVNEKNFINQ